MPVQQNIDVELFQLNFTVEAASTSARRGNGAIAVINPAMFKFKLRNELKPIVNLVSRHQHETMRVELVGSRFRKTVFRFTIKTYSQAFAIEKRFFQQVFGLRIYFRPLLDPLHFILKRFELFLQLGDLRRLVLGGSRGDERSGGE